MKYYLPFGVLLLIIQLYLSRCSESSEYVESERVLSVHDSSELKGCEQAIRGLPGARCREFTFIDPSILSVISEMGHSDNEYRLIIVDDEQNDQQADDGGSSSQVSYLSQQVQTPMQIPMPVQMPMQMPTQMQIQRTNQGLQFGHGNMVQWVGGPVNFDNMVDCKFYRQNPGFCVPMSIYTPCSRCKARVRTIFRTSYKVRCPGQESFPAQLRPYFAWVPTSHRNPKRERGIFSRWRRQFMCIVMAISDIPENVSLFWQHSQITFDSAYETPQYVPLLLGPYGDQSTALGYAAGTNFLTTSGLSYQGAQRYIQNQNSERNAHEAS
ncbi:putative secreted protein [Cryptosporidium tyzzeri]|nr:putative secreted protein [Cryptosporidium tyzzeri]